MSSGFDHNIVVTSRGGSTEPSKKAMAGVGTVDDPVDVDVLPPAPVDEGPSLPPQPPSRTATPNTTMQLDEPVFTARERRRAEPPQRRTGQ
jgi:hypothetical protein